jgi:hypothetical protein
MTRTNIWMEEELFKELKIAAALKGITVQDFVNDAVLKAVRKDNKQLVRLIK